MQIPTNFFYHPAFAKFDLIKPLQQETLDADGFFKDFKRPFEQFMERDWAAFEENVKTQLIKI